MPNRTRFFVIGGIIAAVLLSFTGLALARNGADDAPGDVPGNCDEAEHAADPACTGATTTVPPVPTTDDGADDPAGHDANDDDGADDPAGHDANDDNGADDPATHDVDDDNGADDGADDVSGNCDEPEHAADPACTGATPAPPVDNSGPGNAGDDGTDNSGPSANSGPGSGGSDDTGSDDNSGSGHGGDDSGSSAGGSGSGHGGGDDGSGHG